MLWWRPGREGPEDLPVREYSQAATKTSLGPPPGKSLPEGLLKASQPLDRSSLHLHRGLGSTRAGRKPSFVLASELPNPCACPGLQGGEGGEAACCYAAGSKASCGAPVRTALSTTRKTAGGGNSLRCFCVQMGTSHDLLVQSVAGA